MTADTPQPRYHVFLSHNSADKPAVEELAGRLQKEGIDPWLDKWHLVPGEPWMPAIEQALANCESCAVCIGPGGIGPWQHEEMRAAIDRRVRSASRFRVIPVLLPSGERGERSRLPDFLVAPTWVEFRGALDEEQALHRLVCGIRGLPPGPGPGAAVHEGECPYRGLEYFDVGHAPYFCGREGLTDWLLEKLRPSTRLAEANRFLAIVGASGSGKSSLARAGLLARLKQGALEGSAAWPVAICRPGRDPLESLARALASAGLVEQDPRAALDFKAALLQDRTALHLTARLKVHEDRRLVVLVDQFEEVFTLCGQDELRRAFVDNLLHAGLVPQGRTLVLLTMRADFYGKCAGDAALSAALSDHQELVGAMSAEELQAAIAWPAQRAGCEFEPGLVELLVREVQHQPGGLPLLQHALLELWRRRQGRRLTLRAYQESGGVAGALQKRADQVYEQLPGAQQEICRRIFLRLTQPGEGTEDTKRRVPLGELEPAQGTLAAVEQVVQALADVNTRLVTTEGAADRPEGQWVEVAHEALIRGWPRLRDWIEADRSALRTQRRLTEAAQQWHEGGQDDSFLYAGSRLAAAREWAAAHPDDINPREKAFLAASARRRQRQRLLRGVLVGLVMVLLGGAAAYAWVEKDVAQTNAALAQQQSEKLRIKTEAEAAQRKQAEAVAGLLESVFRKLDPRAEEKGLSLKEQLVSQLDAVAARLDKEYADQPLLQARLRDALAQAELGLGEAGRAAALLKEVLAGRRQHLPADDPLTLTSTDNLANAYQAAGQVDKALPLYEETLAKRRASLGPDHPDTLQSMNNLATAYGAAGQPQKAVPLLEEALARRKVALGLDHPDTLISMDNLAVAYWAARRRDKAVVLLLNEKLIKTKAKLGPDNPETLTTMNKLAVAYQALGQLPKALPLFEEALARRRATLPPDHADLLISMGNLAKAYLASKELEKALPLVRSYLAGQKKRLGGDELRLAAIEAIVALDLFNASEAAEAELVLRDCLAIREKKSPESWLTFNTQSMLGGALLGQKKYKEAEPLLLKGYEGMKKRQAKMPAGARPRLTEALERLVQLFEATGRIEQAARWRKELAALQRHPKK
jgi:tetratricopeptide (TPR) repeat protein